MYRVPPCSPSSVPRFPYTAHYLSIFSLFVKVLLDLVPVGRAGEDRNEIGKPLAHAGLGKGQFRACPCFQPRGKLKAKESAERKADCALAVAIDVLALDFHVGAMA